jgi:hypothetical protein
MASVKIDVALGELLDKITVLEIKEERMTSESQLANVRTELALLREVARNVIPDTPEVASLVADLKEANRQIWDVVDDLHTCEVNQSFGDDFIRFARTAYLVNDKRADAKRAINLLLGSLIVEEKFYSADAT